MEYLNWTRAHDPRSSTDSSHNCARQNTRNQCSQQLHKQQLPSSKLLQYLKITTMLQTIRSHLQVFHLSPLHRHPSPHVLVEQVLRLLHRITFTLLLLDYGAYRKLFIRRMENAFAFGLLIRRTVLLIDWRLTRKIVCLKYSKQRCVWIRMTFYHGVVYDAFDRLQLWPGCVILVS